MKIVDEQVTVHEDTIERIVIMGPDSEDVTATDLIIAGAYRAGKREGLKSGLLAGCVLVAFVTIAAVWIWG